MTLGIWSKLGRKPFEFKKGDIVRRLQEEYFEIRSVSDTGKTFLVHNDTKRSGYLRFNRFHCDLVCPVEYRVDLLQEVHHGR